MVATRAQKRSAADNSNPLLDFGILQNVFTYVGPGHSLFVALVSTWWKDVYFKQESKQRASYVLNKYSRAVTRITVQMTLHSCVFTSPSRVNFAHESGLDCTSQEYQRAAGKHASVTTLERAHELGMLYTETTMFAAAQSNRLAVVQFLHGQGCPWPVMLLEIAASRGYLEVMRWCHEHGCPFHEVELATSYAAESGNIELMTWVLQQSGTQLNARAMRAAASKGQKVCASTCTRSSAHGTAAALMQRRVMDTLTCCAGCATTAVLGRRLTCACQLRRGAV
jgi:hypothetical protein